MTIAKPRITIPPPPPESDIIEVCITCGAEVRTPSWSHNPDVLPMCMDCEFHGTPIRGFGIKGEHLWQFDFEKQMGRARQMSQMGSVIRMLEDGR